MTPEVIQTSFETVRTHDPDRYLTAMVAPRRARDNLMALYAFNTELARIPRLVSEPALGEFRLQWWRDALERMDGTSTMGAPVADALNKAVAAHDLPRPLLLGMIDARSADLDGGGFADLQALKAYLYKSEGAVFALSSRILGTTNSDIGRTANAAALAFGLVSLICSLPHDVAAGRVMLPLSLLENHNIQVETLLAGNSTANLKSVLSELAGEARSARNEAIHKVAGLEHGVRCAFAPLALVEPYLKVLEHADHRPLQDIADINPLVRFWKLWRAR